MGIFKDKYGIGDELLKALKKPLVESKIKGNFKSALLQVKEAIIDTEAALEEAKSDFNNFEKLEDVEFDINKIIDLQMELDNLKRTKEIIKATYTEEFDKELKDTED